MTDIIYFDYWKRGIRHFSNINTRLTSEDYSTMMIHLGSSRGEKWEGDEIINNIVCRDLRYYNNNFKKMLCTEQPKVVILLNNQTEDKIIVRLCSALNIKTIFLMHGTLAITSNADENAKMVNSAFGIQERLQRLPKYFYLFFYYIKAVAFDKNKDYSDYFSVFKYFIYQAITPGSNLYGKHYYKDSITNLALVYSNRDKDNFISRFKYHNKNICVVGNYNLDDLYNKREIQIQKDNKYLLYVESGNTNPKYSVKGWTEELVLDEIIGLSKVLEKYSYKLYVKLHPSSNYNLLLSIEDKYSNIVVFIDNLDNLVLNASGIIGQTSSVLVMAHMINKPICILNIYPLNLLLYEYVEEGIGILVNSYDNFESWVKNNLISINTKKLQYEYGPFDGKCTNRISDAIISIMKA